MQIVLGYNLDSGSYPDALADAEASQGIAVIGPLGLINLLETRLGLSSMRPNHAVRIGQYLRKLIAIDDGVRFYSKSLRADAWSVAKQILSWRDELVLAGWKGNAPPGASNRLETLALLDSASQNSLAPGIGDRLQSILGSLNGNSRIDIQRLQLIEPAESWPPCWQSLFSVLSKVRVDVTELHEKTQRTNTDLGLLQEALRKRQPISQCLKADGSLCFITASSEWEAAEMLVSWLEAVPQLHGSILIIRGEGSSVLDDTFNNHNLPSLGYNSRSRWLTALQVLPLALANRWEPVNAHRLLEFLLLPKSPIPKRAARFFERALRDHPGIGGPKWEHAWNEALADYGSKSFTSKKAERTTNQLDEFRKTLNFWLGEKRYDPHAGMPVDVIREICSRLSQWAAKQGGQDDDALLMASASLFGEMADAVAATGLDRIAEPQLNRILDSVIGEGLERPDICPQAAPWFQVESPAQIWGPAETIIWWEFASADVTPTHVHWTLAEKSTLSNLGVMLEEPSHRRLRDVNSWHDAVKWAGNRLLLFVPQAIKGVSVNPHPLWDEIRHLLRLDDEDCDNLVFKASHVWQRNSVEFAGVSCDRKPVTMVPPPAPQRIWLISRTDVCERESESFSSMEKLIQCPARWVFQYTLGLNPGKSVSLSDGSQMLGILSHAVIEKIISNIEQIPPAAAGERAQEIFDELVPQMAASLLQPGREMERQRFRESIGNASQMLVAHIQNSGLLVKGFEQIQKKELLKGKQFEGRIDLILGTEKEDSVVVDLKWAKRASYRRDELREGKALQLACYAWLLENDRNSFPAGGYFMLAQGELLVSACSLFSENCTFPDVDLKTVWKKAIRAYECRLSQLKKGMATAEGVSPETTEMAPEEKPTHTDTAEDLYELEPTCAWCEYSNLCGV